MTAPSVQVLLGFGTTPSFGNFVVLDHSTLNSSATLAGPTTMVDVSPWLTRQISSTRGRSREVDAYQAGTLNFTLRNEDRRFDPTNTASPYYPGILPRAPVQAFVAGLQVFGGYVDNYDINYEKPNICEVTVQCVDGFSILANAKLSSANFPQQLSGARIAAVLARPEVNYPASIAGDNGLMTVQASTQDQVTALDHCQAVAASEGGVFLIANTGLLDFLDHTVVPRLIAFYPNGQLAFTDSAPDPNHFSYGYAEIGMKSGTELLFNRIEGSRAGGAKQTADNVASQQSFLLRTLSLPQLENVSDSDVLGLCQLMVGRYAQPEVRFDHVVIDLLPLSYIQQIWLANIDLLGIVMVKRTPPGGGVPAQISQLSIIEQISWALDVSAGTYRVTFGLGNLAGVANFVLDNAQLGLLDTDKIGL